MLRNACFTTIVVGILAAVVSFVINSSKLFATPKQGSSFAVLVTGCSSGLGFDVVRALLEEVENVEVFAGVRKISDFAVFKSLKNNRRVHPIVLDVADPSQILPALEKVKSLKLPLYALINNAGVGSPSKVALESDPDGYVKSMQRVFDVNLFGLARLTGASLPLLQQAVTKIGSARIVNIGSLMGVVYTPGCSGYCASKHALEAITADWRFKYETQNISVSILEPGFFRTNLCTDPWCEDGPEGCTRTVLQAIFSSRPSPRYQCASVLGIPASMMSRLLYAIPDRAVDIILRTADSMLGRKST